LLFPSTLQKAEAAQSAVIFGLFVLTASSRFSAAPSINRNGLIDQNNPDILSARSSARNEHLELRIMRIRIPGKADAV
jgi:hypothetical protein